MINLPTQEELLVEIDKLQLEYNDVRIQFNMEKVRFCDLLAKIEDDKAKLMMLAGLDDE